MTAGRERLDGQGWTGARRRDNLVTMPKFKLLCGLSVLRGWVLVFGFFLCAGTGLAATILALAPPMGWNSWDCYGLTITEAQFRANVKVEAAALRPSGYRYAVVDEGWYLANPESASRPESLEYRMDGNGRYQPALNRFTSAEGGAGFGPVAEFVHAQGLKFGIHIIRGIPKQAVTANLAIAGSGFHAGDVADRNDTCPWNPDNYGVKDNAAGQAWYDALLRQYADWGVDYIKVDCIASHPYKGAEIGMIHRAIAKTGRPIVLSLSPGPAPLEEARELGANAQVWRVSDDVWDFWQRSGSEAGAGEFPQSVKNQFAVIASWNREVRPGNWPDADMLPLGRLGPAPGYGRARATRLTHDEQRTLVTLWSMARSPLFFGGNLTELDDWTKGLLTNREVVAIDQLASESREISRMGDLVVWTADLPGGERAVAFFNLNDLSQGVDNPMGLAGFSGESRRVRDVWGERDLGRLRDVKSLKIEPHGCVLLWVGR